MRMNKQGSCQPGINCLRKVSREAPDGVGLLWAVCSWRRLLTAQASTPILAVPALAHRRVTRFAQHEMFRTN
jgi:hypothetical protein